MARPLDRIAAFFRRKEADTYKYTPLDEDASQIRLLTLLPGKFSAKIRINLHTEQLKTNNSPNYEALSYAWGSTEDLVDIFVGSSPRYTLAVTQNLAHALLYLRHPNRERVLWIDALCVNQKDLRERSQQIKVMANIFSMAQRVVVWLGEEENNSTLALQTLDELSTKIEASYPDLTMKPVSRDRSAEIAADIFAILPFTELQWQSINYLMHRAWFERLWIWQEICLANQNAIILCGFTSILWKAFSSAIFCIRTKRTHHRLNGFESRLSHIYQLCDNQAHKSKFSFITLIELTRHCKCSDPRDRVYALFSMVRSREIRRAGTIEADYSRNFYDVYEDMVRRDVQKLGSIELLRHCELHQPNQNVPTWVPDWSSPQTKDPLLYLLAGADSFTDAHFTEKGELRATGLHVATIQYIGNAQFDNSNCGQVIKELQRLASHRDFEASFTATGDRLEMLCRTLCTNIFADRFDPPKEGFPYIEDCINALRKILNHEVDSETMAPAQFRLFLGVVAAQFFGRVFFKTYSGHIGLAPGGAKENDVVCILLGCPSAMILRPIESGQYQVVGESYCHGFMAGEAILGPLPPHIDIVFRFREEIGFFDQTFIERETRNILEEDPRLGPLPTGWRRAENDVSSSAAAPSFVSDENGCNPTKFDPRFRVDALRKRGLDLKLFKLV